MIYSRVFSFFCLVALLKVSEIKGQPKCGLVADVLFVIDDSGSIWEPNFVKQLKFVQSMAESFDIGPNKTRVAAVSFSRGYQQEFLLNSYKDKSSVVSAIRNIQYKYGYRTDTGKALKFARKTVFNRENGARPDEVPQIVILTTDGGSSDRRLTLSEARKLRDKGVSIFAIGVGVRLNKRELRGIGSRPSDRYVVMVTDFDKLEGIQDRLALKTCQVEIKTTATTSTTTTSATTTTATTTTATTTRIPITTTGTTSPTTTTTKSTTTSTEPTTTTSKPTTTEPTTTTKKPTTTTATTTIKTTTEKLKKKGYKPSEKQMSDEAMKLHNAADSSFGKRKPRIGLYGVGMNQGNKIGIKIASLQRNPSADIMFVTDFNRAGSSGNKNRIKIIGNVVRALNVARDAIHVGYLSGACPDVGYMGLDQHYDAAGFSSALNDNKEAELSELISKAAKTLMGRHGRKGAIRIMVLFLSGEVKDRRETAKELALARKNNIVVILVATSPQANRDVRRFSRKPRYLYVVSHEQLGDGVEVFNKIKSFLLDTMRQDRYRRG